MKIRHVLRIGVCTVVTAGLLPVAAEVRVKLGEHGEYQMTQVVTRGTRGNPRAWSLVRKTSDQYVLNPAGDRRGDLWPSIADSNTTLRHPWVIWSRLNGRNYDLAWSRWNGRKWQDIGWVDESGNRGDDLDPDITFDSTGLPHVAWWVKDGSRGRVFISVFLAHGWMHAYPVTDPGIDARFPTVEVREDGMIDVTYETPEGTVSQLVTFQRPDTITDDINPLDHMHLNGEPVLIKPRRP